MADEIAGSAGPNNPVESDELTDDAFASLLNLDGEQPEDQAEGDEPESQPDPEEGDEPEPDEEEDQDQPEATSDLDLDALSPEQLDALAKKTRSKAIARYGELTGKIKDLEAAVQKLTEKPRNPLESAPKVNDPRIAKVVTIEALKEEKGLAETLEEWAQALLDENGSADANDIITTEQGKEFTKKEVLAMRNTARARLKKDIPAKLEELQMAAQIGEEEETNKAHAQRLIPELNDEKSVVAATYKATMEDPVMQEALEKVPALKGKVHLILALAARSYGEILSKQTKGKVPAKPATGELPRPKVPGNPSSAGAASGKPKGKEAEQQAAKAKWEESGNEGDFERYLASTLR